MFSKNKRGQIREKRIISVVLAFLLVALMLPANAFAVGEESVVGDSDVVETTEDANATTAAEATDANDVVDVVETDDAVESDAVVDAASIEDESDVADDAVESSCEDLPSWLTEATISSPLDLSEVIAASGVDLTKFEDYGEDLSDEILQAEGIGTMGTPAPEDPIASEIETLESIEASGNDTSSNIETQAAATWKRMGGSGRYDTMASIVKETYPKGVASKIAIIATGENFPDALAASALAGALDAPIILTAKNSLSAQAEQQINSLGIKHVIIIGSTHAVSANVETKLVKKLGKGNTKRCYGSNRLQTAYKIYELGAKAGAWSPIAFIATANNFPDALSVGPIAFGTSSPIFLYDTANKRFDASSLKALKSGKFKMAIMLGSSSVLPESIRKDLGTLGSASNCFRIAGADRYKTSLAIAEFGIALGVLGDGENAQYAALATGTNFPDALCGAALCGRIGAPLYLTHDSVGGRVGIYRSLARGVYHGEFKKGYVLGSNKAVPDSILSKAKGLGSATSQEQQMIDLINKARSSAGRSALKKAPILQGVGDIRADEIVLRHSSFRPDKDSSGKLKSYTTAFVEDLDGLKVLSVNSMAESSVVTKVSAPADVMKGFMGNTTTKSYILDKNFKYIGVGQVAVSGKNYWVLTFC